MEELEEMVTLKQKTILGFQTHFTAHEGILLVRNSKDWTSRDFENQEIEVTFVLGILSYLKNKETNKATFLCYHYCECMLLH